MPTTAEWMIFLGSTTLFAIVPGPGLLYVLARSLQGGRAEGIRSVLGTSLGALVHVGAAALGLSAVLATSATAFTVVKLAGAAYLIYLGIRALAHRSAALDEEHRPAPRSALTQGVITEILNPKTAVFFLAFLPNFVHPDQAPAPVVFVVLGLIVVAMNMAADIVVACVAGPLGSRLSRHPGWQTRQRVATGTTMIGLGTLLAVAERG